MEVATGGNLRLDNLQSITGSRNVRLTSDGTALNLPKLQTIDGAVLFELAVGQSLTLPQSTSFNGEGSALTANLEAPVNGSISAPNLVSLTRTTLSVDTNRSVTTGTLAEITGAGS